MMKKILFKIKFYFMVKKFSRKMVRVMYTRIDKGYEPWNTGDQEWGEIYKLARRNLYLSNDYPLVEQYSVNFANFALLLNNKSVELELKERKKDGCTRGK